MPAILVLNTGSSSLKYQLIDTDTHESLAGGLVEAIGLRTAKIHHRGSSGEVEESFDCPDHRAALAKAMTMFDRTGPRLATADVVGVGHRVVHGGAEFQAPALVDDALMTTLEQLTPLAPLHNPANIEGLTVAREMFPSLPQVAVFDTAFHQTMPDYAYTYAVPKQWRTELRVRRYGFHGTSHAYVSRKAAEFLGTDPADTNVIVLHLGNGASASAVQGGRSIDTSMGLTPLEGLVMGTRSGDLDPAVPMHVNRVAGLSLADIDKALNKASGLLGLAGASDNREVVRRRAAGDDDARLALDVVTYRLRKYVGAYAVALGRVDAIVFTGGIGENSSEVRGPVVSGLGILGVELDEDANLVRSKEIRDIATPASKIRVLVIPTNEEAEIARQTYELVSQ
ncbi:acetate kinase [Arsenicicoccus piscis]|uniref:Acetate kinase n=1 Tax=Arsenicicoccus piscis TaxID=673954 RepID=A0ABQ6HNE2_9MICO|nr:acetate kinase [Arsenicicoccus piscis]MCH8628558.1 acetate kinase [Arsenicicoccus piscis]GMA19857.1 acetate kinase [Arsenicicoccus piscis]